MPDRGYGAIIIICIFVKDKILKYKPIWRDWKSLSNKNFSYKKLAATLWRHTKTYQ